MSKKLLSLALALVMSLSLAAPAMAADEKAETPVTPYTVSKDVKGKIVILHTNDTHGADMAESGKVIGDAGVAALKKAFEKAGAEVLLFSAGDATQGAPIVNLSQGEAAIEFMNEAGYDAMAPGNHEFDWGVDNLKTILKKAEFPVLAANIVDEKTGEIIFDGYTTFKTKSGLKIGVFGLDTPEAATKTNPEKVQGVKFLAGEELYECAKINIENLKKEKCDFIVCLGHLGIDDETKAGGNRSVDVVEKVSGIDLFIDGHSHSTTDQIAAVIDNADKTNVLNGTKIVSTGTKLANVGVVVIDPKTKAMTDELVSAAAWTDVDSAVEKAVKKTNDEVDESLSAIMGKTEVKLDGERDPGVRTQETNLGDFAADAILWFARKNAGGDDKVDVALTNGGGIRASIDVGEISMKTMNTVFPFGNTVATIELTGQQLLEALESATYAAPKALGAFPQVAGVEFTVNTANKYENGEAYGTYFRCANPGTRVTNVKVGGKDLDLAKTYVLATNDFTAVGGDTYYPFKDVKSTMKDTGIPLDQALSEYTNEILGGTITAEKYGKSAGRITIINRPADLDEKAWWYDAAVKCLDEGVLNGTDAGFSANAEITTATVYQTLYNMEKANVKAEGEWFAPAMTWASEQKIFNGDVASFKDGVIDRKGTMEIMNAYGAMKSVNTEGLFKGNESGDMMLDKALTRGEWAQVLVNLNSAEATPETPATPAVPETPAESEKPTEPETPALTASSTPVGAGTYSFNAATDVTGSKDDNAKIAAGTTFANGALTVVINDEKNGKVVQRVKDGSVYCVMVEKDQTSALEFTVTGTADVTVKAASTGGSNTSMVGIVKLDGTKVENNEKKDTVSGTSAKALTYTGLEAGTYQIVSLETDDESMNRGVRIHSVDITVK